MLNTSEELTFEYVNKDITIAYGKTKMFKDKKLVLGAKITLMDMAILVFENCDISVEEIPGEIISCCGDMGKCIIISFKYCIIHHKRESAYFIKNTSSICSDCIFVRFIGCDFDKSQNIVDIYVDYPRIGSSGGRLSIEKSKINIDIDRKSALFRCNALEFMDSLFFIEEKEENIFAEKGCFCDAEKMEISNCQFMNLLFKVSKYCKCILITSIFKQCTLDIKESIETCLVYNQKNDIVFVPKRSVCMKREQIYIEEYSNSNQNKPCWRGNKLLFKNGLIVKIINVGGSIFYSFVELSINNQSNAEINLDTYYKGFWKNANGLNAKRSTKVMGNDSIVIAPGQKVRVKFWAMSYSYYEDDCTITMEFGDAMIVVKDANTSWYELA